MNKCMLVMVLVAGLVASVASAGVTYTQNFNGVNLLLEDCGWKSTAIVAPAYLLKASVGTGGTPCIRTASNVWAPSIEPMNSAATGTDVLFGDVVTKFGGNGISVSYWVRSENGATERLYLEFKGQSSTWSKEIFAPGTDMTAAKNVSVDLLYADSTGWLRTAGTETFSEALSNVTGWNLWSVRDVVVPGHYFDPKQSSTGLLVDDISFTTCSQNEIVDSNIVNSCMGLTAFTLPVYNEGYAQEAGIHSGGGPTGEDYLFIVTRLYNDHTLIWNVEADVIPTDTFSFYIKNEMAGDASVFVNVYHDGLSAPYQPLITGLTNRVLSNSQGWTLCSIPMDSSITHIDSIQFDFNQSNLVIDFADFILTQKSFADCNGIQLSGYGLMGDRNGDCHVDMLDMRMVAQGWLGCTSPGSAGCTNQGYTQTGTIVRGTAVVDAYLTEWNNQAEWVLADQLYSGNNPPDVSSAKFAMRWDATTDKIYAAVVVTDTQRVFVDFEDNTSYDSSDRIEVYSQGRAAGAYCDKAQQYIVAPGASTGTVWASWPLGYPLMGSPAPGLEYSCRIVGNDIIYELAIPMYDNYAGRLGSTGSTTITQLQTDRIVGLDIVVDSRWDINNEGAFGMLAANSDTGKFHNASAFAKYKLVEQTPCGAWGYAAGDIDENCVVNFKDFAKLAQQWLTCNDPDNDTCIQNWL